MEGILEKDILAAQDLVEKDKKEGKIIELPYIIESDTLEGRFDKKFRTISTKDFQMLNSLM